MGIADLTIDARRLWPGETPWDGPLAFVDLDDAVETPDAITLPPCPVIGLGDPAHPLAAPFEESGDQFCAGDVHGCGPGGVIPFRQIRR